MPGRNRRDAVTPTGTRRSPPRPARAPPNPAHRAPSAPPRKRADFLGPPVLAGARPDVTVDRPDPSRDRGTMQGIFHSLKHLALIALILRAMLPAGWMPAAAGNASFTICTVN